VLPTNATSNVRHNGVASIWFSHLPANAANSVGQQLRDLQDFLTSPLVLHRQGAAVQPATFRSTLLLIRQYPRFCWQKRHFFKPTLVAFEELEHYVAYLKWLLAERQLQPVSVLNHTSAAASVHKFLQRYESFPQLRGRGGDLLLAAMEASDSTNGATVSAAHLRGVGPDATLVAVGAGGAGV
jgi:hypothetical protein